MKNFGKFMTFVFIMIISPIIYGFVFSTLWAWFISPLFQIQDISIAQSIGIILLLNLPFAKKGNEQKTSEFWNSVLESVVYTVALAGLTLLIGWIVTLFL